MCSKGYKTYVSQQVSLKSIQPKSALMRWLESSGYSEFAADIAQRFCRTCATSGFAESFDALTGESLRDRAYTWTASVFLLLAESLSEVSQKETQAALS